jgi:long-chain fatty acid transport protein
MGRFQLPLAAAIAGVIWSSGASAGGFQVTELCVRCQGMRNAGAAALNDQAAGIYFNPANLAGLEAAAFDLSAHYIDGQFKFSDRGSTGAIGQPAVGSGSEDGAVGTPVGSMFYGQPINDRWSWGTAITVPYGLETEYNRNWMGRYHADRSELQIVQINPAVAFKVTDTFSLGLGVVVQHAKATLTNAIDTGTVLNAALSELAPGLPPALLPTPSDPQFDAYARVRGNDLDWGWTAGLHWEPLEGTKLGVGYRSEIEHKLDGSLKVGASDGLRDYLDRLPVDLPLTLPLDVGGTAEVDTPKSVWLGLTQQFGDRWTVGLGATWTEWSSFDEIEVVLAPGGDIVQPEDWDDSWRYSVGAEFALNDQWTLRAGYEYDETPAQDILTPRVPDEDRDWLALGFTWRPYLSPLAIDFAYTHIFIDDYNIDDKEPFTSDLLEALSGQENDLGSTLTGKYEADANIYSIGFRWELAP